MFVCQRREFVIIFFFPFNMEENDSFLKNEVEYQNKKNIKCFGVRASDKTPLHFLKPCDKLYIVAHGNTSVIGTGSRTGPTLTPVELAHLLLKRRFTEKFHRYKSAKLPFRYTLENSGLCTTIERGYARLWILKFNCYRVFRRNRHFKRLEVTKFYLFRILSHY